MNSLRKHLSYANIVATLALVFAMGGSAVAANHYLINSTKQVNPKVLKKLRGSVGKTGAQGLAGAQGPAGARGATGTQGIPGTQGLPGAPGSPLAAQASSAGLLASFPAITLQTVKIDAPEDGFVLVNATGTAFTESASCNPCSIGMRVVDAATAAKSPDMLTDVGTGAAGLFRESGLSIAFMFPVKAGSQTFTLQSGTGSTGLVTVLNPTMVAQFIHEGSTTP